jgi:hypothetical protein
LNETYTADGVRCWEELVTIPTYPVQDADPNPMFLEKRVYQGSSGKVYPNPFIDRVALERVDKAYKAIFLENEFIQLMILPEIAFTPDSTRQTSTTFSIASTSSSRRSWDCSAPGSLAVLNSTGLSITGHPPTCLFTQPLKSTPMAVGRSG